MKGTPFNPKRRDTPSTPKEGDTSLTPKQMGHPSGVEGVSPSFKICKININIYISFIFYIINFF